MGTVRAICISERKGVVKEPVAAVELRVGHGIVGDAHAGDWHRQVSLLAQESIDTVRIKMPEIGPGAFAENIVTGEVDLREACIGDHIELGQDILLEVTQIGKECHTGCAIKQTTGDCIMPREGIFCRVLSGGQLSPGDGVALKPVPEALTGNSQRAAGTERTDER